MTPAIVEALRTFTTELMRSEEFRTALRDVVSELLAAQRPAASEMVPPNVFARERSLNEATVRKMAKDGRIDAVRIGKRQWRVRRDVHDLRTRYQPAQVTRQFFAYLKDPHSMPAWEEQGMLAKYFASTFTPR